MRVAIPVLSIIPEDLEIYFVKESSLESNSFVAFSNLSRHSIAGDENECFCNRTGESGVVFG